MNSDQYCFCLHEFDSILWKNSTLCFGEAHHEYKFDKYPNVVLKSFFFITLLNGGSREVGKSHLQLGTLRFNDEISIITKEVESEWYITWWRGENKLELKKKLNWKISVKLNELKFEETEMSCQEVSLFRVSEWVITLMNSGSDSSSESSLARCNRPNASIHIHISKPARLEHQSISNHNETRKTRKNYAQILISTHSSIGNVKNRWKHVCDMIFLDINIFVKTFCVDNHTSIKEVTLSKFTNRQCWFVSDTGDIRNTGNLEQPLKLDLSY